MIQSNVKYKNTSSNNDDKPINSGEDTPGSGNNTEPSKPEPITPDPTPTPEPDPEPDPITPVKPTD